MKKQTILALLLASMGVGHSAVVFSDDFSEPAGTAIFGKSPDIGGAYTGSTGVSVSANGTLSTVGAGRNIFSTFTSPLGAGQMITVTFDNLGPGNFFSGGYAGVSLYAGGNERVFLGDAGGNANNLSWAVDGGAVGQHLSGNTVAATQVQFNYIYDTGAWTFSTVSGAVLSGTGTAGEAFNEIRIANGSGGDIEVDNIAVSINAVPEPSAVALLGFCGLLFGFARRR